MPSIWANFDHVFEVFQGLFFAFLYRNDALGTDCFDSFYRISYFQTLHDSLLLFLELFKTVCRELCYYSVDQLNIVRKIKNKSKNLKNH